MTKCTACARLPHGVQHHPLTGSGEGEFNSLLSRHGQVHGSVHIGTVHRALRRRGAVRKTHTQGILARVETHQDCRRSGGPGRPTRSSKPQVLSSRSMVSELRLTTPLTAYVSPQPALDVMCAATWTFDVAVAELGRRGTWAADRAWPVHIRAAGWVPHP